VPEWGTYKDCSLVGKSSSFHHPTTPTSTTNHQTKSMSFNASSSDCLGAICGKYSLLPTSNSIPSGHVPASRPCGHIQPPRTTSTPHSPLKDRDESLPFNHQKYPHKRGNIFSLYTTITDIQSCTQKKGECFKDLYIRDLVITGRMKWRGKFHNVETTNFQAEWVSRGLSLEHDGEDQMIPTVDTCLGYTAVLGAKLFSELEQVEEEVSSVFDGCQK